MGIDKNIRRNTMSIEKVRDYLKQFNKENDIQEMDESTTWNLAIT